VVPPSEVIKVIAHPSEPAEAAYSEPPTVHLDLTPGSAAAPAPHLRRLIALVVDVAGVSAVIGVAAILGAAVDLFDLVWFAWVFVIVLVYYLGVSVWLTGQTAGKAVCGLIVRRVGTTDPAALSGFAWSVGRHSIGYVVIDVFGLGALVALINRRRRCLHDYAFGSEVVVRVPVGTSVETPAARMEDFQTRFKAGLAELDTRYAWLFFLGRWLSKVVAVVAALLLFVAKLPPLKWLGDAVTAEVASGSALPPAKPLAAKTVVGLSTTATAATAAVAVLVVQALQPTGIENLNVTITRQTVGLPSSAEIWIMKADGRDEKELTSNDSSDTDPDLFADRLIVFASDRDGDYEIYVMNADGSDQRRLTTADGDDRDPKWSADGKKIVFTSDRDGNGEIYTMNSDGTAPTQLTTQSGDDRDPAWSRDGRKIVFTSDRDGNGEIYTMNSDGTGQNRLTDNPGNDRGAVWSPDGDRLAFTSDRDGNDEIYVMNVDGTGQTRLTSNDASDRIPIWSPDGEKILFDSRRGLVGGGSEIWAMNPDGTEQVQMTHFNVPS
jgi:uncharacterized RDD family membrane protein YckC